MKSGFVTIIGRPNAGKSTLINRFIGEKVAITSPKPQTTRTNLRAIVTEKDYQLVFTDTPGIHTPKTKLGEYMVKTAYSGLESVDAIIYIYDATIGKDISSQDEEILGKLKECKVPVFLAINKVDAVIKDNILEIIAVLKDKVNFKDIIPISALKNDGVKILLDEIAKIMPEGPQYFTEDIITDSTVKEICAEIIREKILFFTNEEVPHGTGIEIVIFKEPKKEGLATQIEANIYCEKDSHKGILIGKQGAMLKRIGSSARHDMEKLTGTKVNLKLWVKVKEDWRNSAGVLKELGYK